MSETPRSWKRIVFSDHAVDQMEKRHIGRKQVRETILTPDSEVSAKRGCRNCWKRFDTVRVRVTISESTKTIVAVTVWKEEA